MTDVGRLCSDRQLQAASRGLVENDCGAYYVLKNASGINLAIDTSQLHTLQLIL